MKATYCWEFAAPGAILFGEFFYFLCPAAVPEDSEVAERLEAIRLLIQEFVVYIVEVMARHIHADRCDDELACLLPRNLHDGVKWFYTECYDF